MGCTRDRFACRLLAPQSHAQRRLDAHRRRGQNHCEVRKAGDGAAGSPCLRVAGGVACRQQRRRGGVRRPLVCAGMGTARQAAGGWERAARQAARCSAAACIKQPTDGVHDAAGTPGKAQGCGGLWVLQPKQHLQSDRVRQRLLQTEAFCGRVPCRVEEGTRAACVQARGSRRLPALLPTRMQRPASPHLRMAAAAGHLPTRQAAASPYDRL